MEAIKNFRYNNSSNTNKSKTVNKEMCVDMIKYVILVEEKVK